MTAPRGAGAGGGAPDGGALGAGVAHPVLAWGKGGTLSLELFNHGFNIFIYFLSFIFIFRIHLYRLLEYFVFTCTCRCVASSIRELHNFEDVEHLLLPTTDLAQAVTNHQYSAQSVVTVDAAATDEATASKVMTVVRMVTRA